MHKGVEVMNELQIFQNPDFGSIRTIVIDDEPWFVGKDVASALGYKNSSDAISKHVDDEDKQIFLKSQNAILDFTSNRGLNLINESGLYCLILGSKLETAKKFKRWVTNEVLPTLRKTGVYSLPQSRQRDLTTDDYLKAAHIVSKCRNERLPYVINFLEQAGFYIPEVKSKVIKQIPYPNVDLVELLNRYTIPELCKKLGLGKSTISYYRSGKYEPLPDRRKFIIETLE